MNKGVNNSIPEDTISRAAAIDALDKCHCGGKDENGRPWIYKENAVEAIEMVEPSPPAEPQIIHCKDCGHRDDYGCCKYWRGLSMRGIPIATDDYDFCRHAKRKVNELHRT